MLPSSWKKWILSSHAVRVVNEIVDRMDLDALLSSHKGSGARRHGMDPSTASASDLDFLASVTVTDTDHIMQIAIVRGLGQCAKQGNPAAKPALQRVADEAASMYIHKKAQHILNLLSK